MVLSMHSPVRVPSAPDPTRPPTPPAPTDAGPTAGRRLLGRRLSVVALLAVTAGLYLWDLAASGYANSFYSAAVQAGSQSWKAFFFGSLDAGNAITVDKPPASLWLMALSVRIFGLSSWSILVPQALLGVATVGVVYATVRRTAGHGAGLLGGAVLALTPVAALMFRFNNPDALLVLLLALAGYATLRATKVASGRWLALAGVLVGFGFLTKMLQAFLVLPAFVVVYLIAAPTTLRRRLVQLLGALATMIVSLGWWVAIVELVPASWRPYVGGSENNSVLDLVFGYNGLNRIFGGGGGGGRWGSPGITRLFDGVSGGMVAWLVPAALVLGAVAAVIIGRAPRTDRTRAGVLLWGSWLVVTALVFSFMEGTYHDYYTVALAPAVAGLIGTAAPVLWHSRQRWVGRLGLAAATALTAVWGVALILRATEPYVAVAWVIGVAGGLAALGFLVVDRLPTALALGVSSLALVGALAGPAAYTAQTVTTAHQGSIVTAGPAVTGASGGPGGGAGRDGGQGGPGARPPGQTTQSPPGTTTGQPPQVGGTSGGLGGGTGGGMGAGTAVSAVTQLLQIDASAYRWAAATTGSQTAATYQLASEEPVMAVGGFTGGDPAPTLAEFQALVAQGKIHYYLAGDQRGGARPGGQSERSASAISTWVTDTFTATSVGGVTVYDLTQAS